MGFIVNNRAQTNRNYIGVYYDDGSSRSFTEENSVYMHEEVPFDESIIDVEFCFEISKAKEDEQLVSGWANVAVNADGSLPLDWQDDIISAKELEKAAIKFMLAYRSSGEMHQGEKVGDVVESIVFTKEKQEAIGIPEGTVPQGWFITVKVYDSEVFAKVKDGTYKMFSIQGSCRRVKL